MKSVIESGFLELVRLHVWNAVRILRVVAQDADLEHAVLLLGSGSGRGGGSRRGLLSFLGHFVTSSKLVVQRFVDAFVAAQQTLGQQVLIRHDRVLNGPAILAFGFHLLTDSINFSLTLGRFGVLDVVLHAVAAEARGSSILLMSSG